MLQISTTFFCVQNEKSRADLVTSMFPAVMHRCGWKRLVVILTEVPSVWIQPLYVLCTVGAQVEDTETLNFISRGGGREKKWNKRRWPKGKPKASTLQLAGHLFSSWNDMKTDVTTTQAYFWFHPLHYLSDRSTTHVGLSCTLVNPLHNPLIWYIISRGDNIVKKKQTKKNQFNQKALR